MKIQLLKQVYGQLINYSRWLAAQQLPQHELRACVSRVNHFFVFLGTEYGGSDNIVCDPFRRDDALREYRRFMREHLKASPASVNASMHTLDGFFRFLGMAPSRAAQETESFQLKPLSPTEEVKFRGAARESEARDRALAILMLESGIFSAECSVLNLEDVHVRTTSGYIRVLRNGNWQELELKPTCRLPLQWWLEERKERWPAGSENALFLDDRGVRLSPSGIDLAIRRIGRTVGLHTPARVLSKTFLLNEARREKDHLTVAELLAN